VAGLVGDKLTADRNNGSKSIESTILTRREKERVVTP
jgi:hypothetical protein